MGARYSASFSAGVLVTSPVSPVAALDTAWSDVVVETNPAGKGMFHLAYDLVRALIWFRLVALPCTVRATLKDRGESGSLVGAAETGSSSSRTMQTVKVNRLYIVEVSVGSASPKVRCAHASREIWENVLGREPLLITRSQVKQKGCQ